MKKITRMIAVLLAVSMVAGIAGCGKTGKTNDNGNGRTKFRIVTTRHNDSWPTDFLKEGVMKQLEDKYNIDIEWEVYTVNDWQQEKNLMFASPDDLPDAFLGSLTLGSSDIEAYKDQFVELTDLIAEQMPNLSAILKEDSELKAVMTNREGEVYGLGKKLPFRPEAANVPMINKKWLDNLGLEIPNTYKELEAVLQAFKDKDADGDGNPNNEIPYSYCGALNMDARHILAPFGTIISRAGNYMGLDENGEPFFLPITEKYKEAVKWMHNLYEKGLIDPEHFTQNNSMYTSKVQATGGSQVGYIFGWSTAAAEANKDEFVAIVPVSGPDGKRYVESDNSYLDMSGNEFCVTKNCKNPELLLQWADEFYTDLVAVQSYYGSIPDQIKDNGDGTYTLLPPQDKDLSYDYTAWSNSFRDFGPKYVSKAFQETFVLPTDGGDGEKLQLESLYKDCVKTNFPVVQYKAEDVSKRGMYSTNINSYVESQYAHWVVDGGIEKEWDSYLKTLDEMGVQDMLKLNLEAYDFYVEQKNK